MPTALIVDENMDHLLTVAEIFRSLGYTTETAQDLSSARDAMLKRMPEVALFSEYMDGRSSLDLLEDLDLSRVMEIYLMSEERSIESASRAMRVGVSDYFDIPIDKDRLEANLRDLSDEIECDVGRHEVSKSGRGLMVGESMVMQRLYRLIRKCAPSDASVLIAGESGAGKELVMQTIHELSPRAECELVTVNCSAISKELMESELFGHTKGSFTGATRGHRGLFERAAGGTLFLDEITEMHASLQAKLLRALEANRIRRVGGESDIAIDVRVIAATNTDPAEALDQGRLREDIYYRLAQFPIRVPPLRERGSDIQLLADHFLEQQNRAEGIGKSFSDDVVEAFRLHDWPGNVRELKNAVVHGHLIAGDVIELTDLPDDIQATVLGNRKPVGAGAVESIDEVERRHILATLEHFEGDKKKAAETLGISLKTLYNRLNQYNNP